MKTTVMYKGQKVDYYQTVSNFDSEVVQQLHGLCVPDNDEERQAFVDAYAELQGES